VYAFVKDMVVAFATLVATDSQAVPEAKLVEI
jgi:hypothetical protein